MAAKTFHLLSPCTPVSFPAKIIYVFTSWVCQNISKCLKRKSPRLRSLSIVFRSRGVCYGSQIPIFEARYSQDQNYDRWKECCVFSGNFSLHFPASECYFFQQLSFKWGPYRPFPLLKCCFWRYLINSHRKMRHFRPKSNVKISTGGRQFPNQYFVAVNTLHVSDFAQNYRRTKQNRHESFKKY